MTDAVDADVDKLGDWLWDRRHRLLFKVRLSVLYHLKRERYFDVADKWCSMLTAVAATAAVAALLKRVPDFDLAAAIATAVLALIPLVLNPAERARKHGQIAADFRRLRADAERAGERWTEAQCDEFTGRALDIETTEPAALGALVVDCQNQVTASVDPNAKTHRLRLHERLLMHLWDFDTNAILGRPGRPA